LCELYRDLALIQMPSWWWAMRGVSRACREHRWVIAVRGLLPAASRADSLQKHVDNAATVVTTTT